MPAIAIPSSCWLILILYCACLLFGTRVVVAFDCDFIRVSNEDGIKNGSFTAPLFNGHPIPPQGIQCIYTFIALSTERVRISFRDFDLAGRPPDCFHEYIDLYTELRNASEDLVQTDKFGGRFCGRIPPRERWSLYSTIIIVFSSNRNLSASFFSGTYEFVEGSVYDMGAPLHSPFSCTFVMKSWVKRLGSLVSPAYPGVYPQRIMCSYQFLGQKGQRVRVEFMDFDLFSGGTHCPYDRLIIYDGNTEQDPVIDAYCGPRRNLVVFSSQENLFISFITNRSGGENRGFHGIFAFDESWVDIGFVTGEHIRGTECDQRILSHGRNAGVIKSPNWPYPYLDNKECRYFIEGLNNPDDLERVKLNIKTLQMPQPLGALKGDCSAGGVFIWLDGRETRGKPDISICGSDPPRSTIISTDSKLLLKFISGSTKGLGFTIQYEFETFFSVPGTPHPVSTKCEVRYRSASAKEGEFHSPRHPGNYQPNHNCTYLFEGEANEQAHVEFDHFKLDGNGTYAHTCDNQDYIDIYEILDTVTHGYEERPIGRYCGVATPAPVKTRFGVRSIKMYFATDSYGVTNGFRGRYWFDQEKSVLHEDRLCSKNISDATHGLVVSPNYDGTLNGKYQANADCEWHITARPGHNILINVTTLVLEGDQTMSGCPGAALKIYTEPNMYPTELCGEQRTSRIYLSHRSTMKLLFLSARKATGNMGFQIVWNEVHHPTLPGQCAAHEFLCEINPYCIVSELQCNGEYNCGDKDISDENPVICGDASGEFMGIPHTILGGGGGAIGGFLVIVIAFTTWICRRKSKERRRKRQQMQQAPHDWSS